MSFEFATILGKIARGLCERYRYAEAEDFAQEFIAHVIRKIDNIKVDGPGSPFNYLTTIAANLQKQLYRARQNYKAKIERLYKQKKENSRK